MDTINVTFSDEEVNLLDTPGFWEKKFTMAMCFYYGCMGYATLFQFMTIAYVSSRLHRATKNVFTVFLFYIGYIFVTTDVNGLFRLTLAIWTKTTFNVTNVDGPHERELELIDMWLRLFLHLICLLLPLFQLIPRHLLTYRAIHYACLTALLWAFTGTAYYDSFPCFHKYISTKLVNVCMPVEVYGPNPPVYVGQRLNYLSLRFSLTAISFVLLAVATFFAKNRKKYIFKFIVSMVILSQISTFLEILYISTRRTIFGDIYHTVVLRYIRGIEALLFTIICFHLLRMLDEVEKEFKQLSDDDSYSEMEWNGDEQPTVEKVKEAVC